MFTLNLSLPVVKEAKGHACRTPYDFIDQIPDEIKHAAQEAFVVMTLNTKYKIIDKHIVSLGIANACLVHPREVFRAAIADGAAAIIIGHNHPSGDPQPSAEDIRITKRIIEAGRIIDIEVLDHVVIGRPSETDSEGFISLRESGLVSFSK